MIWTLYNRLDVRVNAPDIEVVRKARLKLTPECRRDPGARAKRKEFYQLVLDAHHYHQSLVATFRL